jgi:hypothetical protein
MDAGQRAAPDCAAIAEAVGSVPSAEPLKSSGTAIWASRDRKWLKALPPKTPLEEQR